ncbi:hypothetical protein DEJ49_21395 [Streptomyces venezuelae]|uniref:Uncharacterized protein n=1 Tax=Streptomyces venezuelae TaxID=54571 RepID=A0A5P2CLL6_STRVZ|nr:hypothetical protein DEJ49_21395 [Streptomyces venezuelae]
MFKCVFLLSMLRMFAAPATKDFFDRYLVPWPTWEWPLYALVPVALIYLFRRPDDWDALRSERGLIKWALLLYLLYALLFAVGAGVWILWAAVAICVAGLIGIWHLNHKERLRAA